MKNLMRYLIFPLTLAGVVALSMTAVGRGFDPEVVLPASYIGTLLWIAFLERVLPFDSSWNRSTGDLVTDVMYFPTTLAVSALVQSASVVIAVAIGAELSRLLGSGLWPSSWPLIAQVVLACLIGEFPNYWAHRATHTIPFLWRFHRVHHSSPRLYWFNGTRFHPLDISFRILLGATPLAVLGVTPEALVIYGVVVLANDPFQHTNIDIRLGALSWIFSVGALHRWHHSILPEEADRNYGGSFIIWDVIFGTRYLPSGRQGPEVVGIDAPGFPTRYWQQLWHPFRP